MEGEPDWKELERIVGELHRLFDPQAEIRNNDRIVGRRTGSLREVDISIRRQAGCYNLLGIVDCKLRSRKVDSPAMGAFIALKEDVAAHFAVIVNKRGFTKGALSLAKFHGIHAMTLRDTRKAQWPTSITLPVALFVVAAVLKKVTLTPVNGETRDVNLADVRLVDKHTGQVVPLWDYFVQDWNAAKDLRAGNWKNTLVGDDEKGKPLGQVDLWYAVTHDLYFQTVPLDFLGLVNQETGAASTSKLESGEIDFREIVDKWKRLDKISLLKDGTLVVQLKMTSGARLDDFVRKPVLPDLKMVMRLNSQTPISITADQPNDFAFGVPAPGLSQDSNKSQGGTSSSRS